MSADRVTLTKFEAEQVAGYILHNHDRIPNGLTLTRNSSGRLVFTPNKDQS